VCPFCGFLEKDKPSKTGKPLKKIDGYLVEITGPTLMKDRPKENQREYQFKIKDAISRFQSSWYGTLNSDVIGVIDSQAVRDLLEVGTELKWKNKQDKVYYMMCRPDDQIINVSLLQEIAEILDFHPKWVTRRREFLEDKFKREAG
jgi:hypothetical protein